MVLQPMFEDLPTDVPDEYLSGLAAFVASDGERTEGMGKNDYIYALNQLSGVERIPAVADGRASQQVVEAEDADPDDVLTQEDYTNSVFEAEVEAWANTLLAYASSEAEAEAEEDD